MVVRTFNWLVYVECIIMMINNQIYMLTWREEWGHAKRSGVTRASGRQVYERTKERCRKINYERVYMTTRASERLFQSLNTREKIDNRLKTKKLPKTYLTRFSMRSFSAEIFFCFVLILCFVNLPVNLPNSSKISSLPFDFGMLPTKRRRFGTLTFIFKHLPGLIS